MTCSRSLDRLLQATCVGLVGMLAVGGCGGSSSTSGTPDAAPPRDTAILDTIIRDTAPLGACCGLKAQSLPAGPRRDRPGLAGHC